MYYEDLISDRQAVFAEMVAFLDLPFSEPETSLIRQNPESLKDLVTNYKELKAPLPALLGNRFSKNERGTIVKGSPASRFERRK